MGFTELSHAFIAAKYYVYLKEIFGDRGEAAFLHATRYYGEQRGRRMAQRAIRDGKPLTYETYCQYGGESTGTRKPVRDDKLKPGLSDPHPCLSVAHTV